MLDASLVSMVYLQSVVNCDNANAQQKTRLKPLKQNVLTRKTEQPSP